MFSLVYVVFILRGGNFIIWGSVPILLTHFYITYEMFSSTTYYDAFPRVQLNNISFINLYFMWTNLWYILLFLLALVIIKLFTQFILIRFFFLSSTLGFLFLLYLSYMNFYITLVDSCLPLYSQERLNALLRNNFNKIHPYLLYWAGISSITTLFVASNLFGLTSRLHTLTLIGKLHYCNNYAPILITLLALHLGGWWAAQEGSWGGWWNWDSSEFFGLVVLSISLISCHIYTNINSKTFLYVWLYVSSVVLAIFFIELQLNFAISAHNFGFQVKQFRNLSLPLSILLVNSGYLYLRGTTFILNTRHYFYKKTALYIKLKCILPLFFYTLVLIYNAFLLNNLSVIAPGFSAAHVQQAAQISVYIIFTILILLYVHLNYSFWLLYCNYINLFTYVILTTKWVYRRYTTATSHMLFTSAVCINLFFQDTHLVYLETISNISHRTYLNWIKQQLGGVEYNPLTIVKATTYSTKFLTLTLTTTSSTILHIFNVWIIKLQATTFDFIINLINLIIPFVLYYFFHFNFKKVII